MLTQQLTLITEQLTLFAIFSNDVNLENAQPKEQTKKQVKKTIKQSKEYTFENVDKEIKDLLAQQKDLEKIKNEWIYNWRYTKYTEHDYRSACIKLTKNAKKINQLFDIEYNLKFHQKKLI